MYYRDFGGYFEPEDEPDYPSRCPGVGARGCGRFLAWRSWHCDRCAKAHAEIAEEADAQERAAAAGQYLAYDEAYELDAPAQMYVIDLDDLPF